MMTAIDFVYRYAQPSALRGPRLHLVTTGSRDSDQPYFFKGRARHPERLAAHLLALSQVVRTHFFLPRPAILDPVFTSSDSILRAEGFSGCVGVYARVDLSTELFDVECRGRGTTNVDFNEPMRRALLGVRREQELHLSVGDHQVTVETSGTRMVEKKVKLPLRWVKSFSEVQAYQPRLQLTFELKADEALIFLRSFPRVPPKSLSYVVSSAGGLRLSQRPAQGAIPLGGIHRLAVLEPLLRGASGLRLWWDPASQVSAWEVHEPTGRFTLLLSPELYRGFSGEGQQLEALGSGSRAELLRRVRAKLNWDSRIDVDRLATQLLTAPSEVTHALAVLGSQGLVGYDALERCYFHRELPFDLERVESLQPRLLSARKLLAAGKVTALGQGEFAVASEEVKHIVRITRDGSRCSCPWFSKHQGSRGPCKHVLAVQLYEGDQ